ncbi:MAG: radical SAM family heme chaperone HemW [Candidatus Gastranaerophilaceae bacterium]
MIQSAYIHIPFCRRKCGYCAFSSFLKLELKNEYINALCKEIHQRYNGEKLKTLYIGGGTPSLLEVADIKKIISGFNFASNPEITCEANPEKLTLKWLSSLYDIGINRLSLGIQSFNDDLLKLIGRKHSVKDAFNAVKNARIAGFENINIDLIYGLPNQTMADISASTIIACELNVPHISTYGLKIEEGTAFFKQKFANLPNDDIQADMYLKIIEIAEKYGYKHYEISNFSKEGFESRHNVNYWNAKNYYGFGCAAAGFEDNTRYCHENTIEKYCKNPVYLTEKTTLSKQNSLEENIFLGLRKAEGININYLNQKFEIDFEKKYKNILQKYDKYFIKSDGNYALNNEGFLISNIILSEFI